MLDNTLTKITIKDIRFMSDIVENCVMDVLTRCLCLSDKQNKEISYMIGSQIFYILRYHYNV